MYTIFVGTHADFEWLTAPQNHPTHSDYSVCAHRTPPRVFSLELCASLAPWRCLPRVRTRARERQGAHSATRKKRSGISRSATGERALTPAAAKRLERPPDCRSIKLVTLKTPNKTAHNQAQALAPASTFAAAAPMRPASDATWIGTALTSRALMPDGSRTELGIALFEGSQKPSRSSSKSKMETKCSRKTPPSTQRSAVGSSGSKPPNCKRRGLRSEALAAPSPCAALPLLGFRQRVVSFFSLPPSHTIVCVQTVPSGFVSICSSICSPAAAGPGAAEPSGMPHPGIGKGSPAEVPWPPSAPPGARAAMPGIGKGKPAGPAGMPES
mmetsp:Transcript_172543/g.553151  ORF Transcript_172543/g.553151 Transcript_172543/m.553151 type:complete len:327 (-) Transcript_172543:1629-2609(-)